jgi:hypothetical protein
LNRKERKEHEVRKGFSLHDLHNFSFAFFFDLCGSTPASEEKPSGVIGMTHQ